MFDLKQECIKYIKTKIEKYITNYKLYIIELNNEDTEKEFPDINIVIKAENFDAEMKKIIDFELIHSSLPCKVNIIDIEEASNSSLSDKMIEV